MTEPTNGARRLKIIAKVQALLSRTTENGCTEAEAVEAAAKADELMREYDLTYTDIEAELKSDSYGARARPSPGVRAKREHESWRCHSSIGMYWDCKCWGHGKMLVFFGSRADTEAAHLMAVMIQIAMDSEWARYQNSPARPGHVHGRTLRASFMAGMVIRINQRLKEMKDRRTAANGPVTGTALVVVKGQVVTEKYGQYLRDNGIKISKSRASGLNVGDSGAYAAGQQAASRIDLGGTKVGGAGNTRIGQG